MLKRPSLLLCALLTSVLFMAAPGAMAQSSDQDSVEALMEGFDENPPPSEGPQLENLMEGFDENATDAPADQMADSQPGMEDSAITIDGYLKLGAAWNIAHQAPEAGETDWRGLSKLRSEAQFDMLAKWHPHWRMLIGGKVFYDAAYGLRGQNDFSDEVIAAYERETEWREFYLQGRLARPVDLKSGRQIVVWGRSDNIRITDVLNPLDLREPGLTDIEDLRLPVTMTRLDGYLKPWDLTGIAVHEIRFNKNPVWGHDFYPGSMPQPTEEEPSDGGGNTELAAALNGVFSGKDISFYWANVFDDNGHVTTDTDGKLKQKHARITMWGAAGNLALGNWLLKGEAAYRRGLKFYNNGNQALGRIDVLLGVEYSGWDETSISLEWADRHLIDFDERLESSPDYAQEDEIINALRISHTLLNETVELTLLSLIYGPLGQDGALARISVEYDWSDAVSLKLGAALYQSGDKYTQQNIGDNDRVFAEIKYSF